MQLKTDKLPNIGVARGNKGAIPSNLYHIFSFCSSRGGVPHQKLLLAKIQYLALSKFWAGYTPASEAYLVFLRSHKKYLQIACCLNLYGESIICFGCSLSSE